MQLSVAHDMESLQQALLELAQAGKSLALVPTMGALHAGHMALIDAAKQYADEVAVSIFVNPKQFGPNEDFVKYPRMLQADIDKAHEAGATLVYAPGMDDIYPEGFSTTISVGPLAEILCGKTRPGHFDGVATVVTKLLLRFLPLVAVFGEKDYQQLTIIRRVVADLDIPVDIIGVATHREADGLAMSSRNAYLTNEQREIAPILYGTLQAVAARIHSGMAVETAVNQGIAHLSENGYKVDYMELRDADTLEPLQEAGPSARLLAAAWLGATRLIDNIAL